MKHESVKIYFDGGSRGNPGPAAGAAYADYQGGHEKSCFIASATNNEAEYRGLLMGIALAKELKLTHVTFLGDSKLVVMQVSGQWQAKHPMMHALKLEALEALRHLPDWDIDWIRRELNSEADRIANETMDLHQGIEKIFKVAPPEKAQPSALTSEPGSIRADILHLNQLGAKASFADFRSLKVGGIDAYSRASLKVLESFIPRFTEVHDAYRDQIKRDSHTQTLSDQDQDKLLINALRWRARGLNGDLPLRKVLVDLEITNNIRGKKK